MGVIGDYITLTWEDYEQGIAPEGYTPIKMANASNAIEAVNQDINRRAAALHNKGVQKKLDLLAEEINKLSSLDMSKIGEGDNRTYQQVMQQINNITENIISSKFPNIAVDYARRAVIQKGAQGQSIDMAQFFHKEDKKAGLKSTTRIGASKKGSTYLSTIQQRVDAIGQAAEALWGSVQSSTNLNDTQKDVILLLKLLDMPPFIKEIEADVEAEILGSNQTEIGRMMANEGWNIIKNNLEQGAKQISKDLTVKGFSKNNRKSIPLREFINNIISNLSAVPMVAAGDIFEYWLAAAIYSLDMRGMTEQQICDKLNSESSAVIGTSGRSGAGLALSNLVAIPASVNKKNISTTSQQGDFAVTMKGTQEKVDVQIHYQGTELKISAKNYNKNSKYYNSADQRFLTVQTGNLLTAIQNENNNNFINHWINLNTKKIDDITDTSGDSKSIATIALINDTLEKLLVLKGLSGDNTVRFDKQTNSIKHMDTANVFAINDSSTGDIRFFEMGSLVQKVLDSHYYKAELNGLSEAGKPFSEAFSFEDVEDNSIARRLETTITSLHSIKMHAMISFEAVGW